jgi:putative ABC transport system permease protein
MTFWLLIRRSLTFYLRSHFGVILGSAIGTAALAGALVVGDSVRGSLRERALQRLQGVDYALSSGDRFFQEDLSKRLEDPYVTHATSSAGSSGSIQPPTYAPTAALQLSGTVSRQDGRARANRVVILGIDPISWYFVARGMRGDPSSARQTDPALVDRILSEFGLIREARDRWAAGEMILLNHELATQLSVVEGDEVVVRLHKPSLLAQDAVITPREGNILALRLKVGPILPTQLLGDFSLVSNQTPAANAFLPLDFLNKKLEMAGQANLILHGPLLVKKPETGPDAFAKSFANALPTEALPRLSEKLEQNWSLADAQLSVRLIGQPATANEALSPTVVVSSARIFLEPQVAAQALRPRTQLLTGHAGITNDTPAELSSTGFVTNGSGVLTYLANLIAKDDSAAPYSMITAAGRDLIPAGMRDDEILINDWLANDLQAKTGDKLRISYYVVDSASHLTERTNVFTVRAAVPISGKYADRTLMPEFPGIAKAESTHDWDAGFPLVYKIREKDEAYWKQYRGTPKAFITLSAGQAMWASRFGNLTSIRYVVPEGMTPQECRDLVSKNLLANLHPAELGFQFQAVRDQALRAAEQSQDFGQLFIGFSLFLVVAALLLLAILFQFSLDQRQAEVGTLLALGFRPKQVRRLLLGEALMLSVIAGILGTALGLAYAKVMLWALTTIWRNAVGVSVLRFHGSSLSLLIGFLAGTAVALLTIWLALRKQGRQPARELLAGEVSTRTPGKGRWALLTAILAGVGAMSTVGYALSVGQTTNPEIFFTAGSLLLIAGLAWSAAWLNKMGRKGSNELSLSQLGLRACARRSKRSLATIGLLASGCFVIVSIGVFRLDANQDASKRTSRTGGFSLIGQATVPVIQDLNTESGRQFFGLSDRDLPSVRVVPFRVRDGDEASCLNLNRAQRPRLLGVQPDALQGRFTFAEAAKGLDVHAGWQLLRANHRDDRPRRDDEIPAIGDANSIQWALGKSVGDTLDYVDERGRTFKLRLVGAVANSILQGSLVIDEAEFVKRFPAESGYRFFLIDTPPATAATAATALSRALQDQGLELTSAVRRLDEFNAVQNTYLGTFQILGGLGLLLGSAGLGVVVLRNVLERRGELALLLAVGFRKRAVQWLVLAEHGALLGLGLALGLLAAAVAVLPALLSPAHQLPYASLGLTLGAVLINGLVWTWLATRAALRGDLLVALRNE